MTIGSVTGRLAKSTGKATTRALGRGVGGYVREFGILGNVIADVVSDTTGMRSFGRNGRGRGGQTGVVGEALGAGALMSMASSLKSIDATLKNIYRFFKDSSRDKLYSSEALTPSSLPTVLSPSGGKSDSKGGMGILAGVLGYILGEFDIFKTKLGGMLSGLVGTIGSILKGGMKTIMFGLIKSMGVGLAAWAGYELGKILKGWIDSIIESITGVVGSTLGTALYDIVDTIKDKLPFLKSDAEKQREQNYRQNKAAQQQRLKEQGGKLTPAQAQTFRQAGVPVDMSKVDESVKPSTTPLQPPSGTITPMMEMAKAETRAKFGMNDQALGGIDYEAYREAVAKRESGGEKDPLRAENRLGFIGRYQLGVPALIDAGYMKPKPVGRNQKEQTSNPDNWVGGMTKEKFLSSRDIQDDAFRKYTLKNFSYSKSKGTIKKGDAPDKIAGVLMASHLVGAGGAKQALINGVDKRDANNVSALEYYKIGKSSQAASASMASASTPIMDKGMAINEAATKKNGDTNINASTNIVAPSSGGGGGQMSSAGIPSSVETQIADSEFNTIADLTHY